MADVEALWPADFQQWLKGPIDPAVNQTGLSAIAVDILKG
jgi:hypothetical protein